MRSNHYYSNAHVVGFPNEDWKINTQESPSNHNHDKSISPYGPLYQLSNMCLENGYSVLYGAESIPDDSAAELLRENIKNVNITQQVLNNISKGYLTVIDADLIYENAATGKSIVDFWKSNIKQTQEKLKGIKGTMIFSVPDSYFKNDKHDTFMMFEEAMGRTFPTTTSLICWYLEKWLSNLSLTSIIKVLTTHKYTIYSRWKYKEWNKEEIIDTISRGIDKGLGEDSATLLFQSIKTRHKFNHDAIVSRPIVFEGILKGLVGEDSADLVINSIREEFVKGMSYTREAI